MARTKKTNETVVENVESASVEQTEPEVAETEEAVENVTEEKSDAEQEDKVQKMYMGVSVPGMKSGTVFVGNIPKVIDVPFVRELCIPLEQVAKFNKEKAVTTSRAAFCYRKSAELAKKLKK